MMKSKSVLLLAFGLSLVTAAQAYGDSPNYLCRFSTGKEMRQLVVESSVRQSHQMGMGKVYRTRDGRNPYPNAQAVLEVSAQWHERDPQNHRELQIFAYDSRTEPPGERRHHEIRIDSARPAFSEMITDGPSGRLVTRLSCEPQRSLKSLNAPRQSHRQRPAMSQPGPAAQPSQKKAAE